MKGGEVWLGRFSRTGWKGQKGRERNKGRKEGIEEKVFKKRKEGI